MSTLSSIYGPRICALTAWLFAACIGTAHATPAGAMFCEDGQAYFRKGAENLSLDQAIAQIRAISGPGAQAAPMVENMVIQLAQGCSGTDPLDGLEQKPPLPGGGDLRADQPHKKRLKRDKKAKKLAKRKHRRTQKQNKKFRVRGRHR